MSPLRWDVLLVGLVLALPVLALGLRGDLATDEVMSRLVWCLVAGWVVVALLRFVSAPRPTTSPRRPAERESTDDQVDSPIA
jgi:amino acid permease